MGNNIAFLYPGQGSQQVGMGFDLYQAYPQAKKIFDQADQLLGFSLSELCFKGPEEELNSDLNAQLAVYTLSCVLTDILRDENVLPDVVSGYSSGFYAAAYASGCFDFATGLYIVRRAGEILLDEGKKIDGSMAVVFGIPLEKVESICRRVGDAEVAIQNTPRQTVISGLGSSLGRAMELALNEGALDVYPLSVDTAYHSRFVEQSSVRLLQEIKDKHLGDPKIPLISYLSLDRVAGKEELKNIMADQLSHPVLWVDVIKGLRDNSTKLVIEIGPGAVISRTVRWIDRSIETMVTATKERLLKVVETCREL